MADDVAQANVVETSPLEVDDFSGGKTDYYLDAPMNKFKEADNLLLVKHGGKAKLLTRPGSEIYNATCYQIPAGAQRISSLQNFQNQLFIQSSKKIYYIQSSIAWTTLQGPTGNDVFPSGVDTASVYSYATWNKHLFVANDQYSKPQKIYKPDGTTTWRVRTAGLPKLASNPTLTAGGVSTHAYVYRFIRAYTYTVGTKVYLDRGPAVEVALDSAAAPDSSAVAISAIAVLANGVTDNYDTASTNLIVEIYRTTDGGNNFFLAGHVANGTTTFNDSMSDATLQDQEPLYTESGAPDNDPPPLCKVVHVVGDLGFYGNVKLSGEVFSNRLYQSIPGDIDSVPGTFFEDLQDDIVAISSVYSYPITLCTDMVFRLDGNYDELGGGTINPVRISDTAGCVSSLSVVQTLIGIFWAGKDGFYYSDGFNVSRINDGLDTTYAAFASTDEQKRRIVGRFDKHKKRIWWTVQSSDNDVDDCDKCFVLDLNWGLSNDMPFTTQSGGASFAPSAIEFVDGDLIRADTRGYLFHHSEALFVDPKVDVASLPSTWSSSTIIYDYVSIATSFGTIKARKFVPRLTINCKNETNLSLQITSINDDGRRRGDLKPIRFRGNITWGDPDIYWGDPDLVWNYGGLIDDWLRFPAGGLRCEYKQVELTNAKVAIISSDLLGTCDVDPTVKTATLTNSTDFDWPTNSVDYYLAFEFDGFVNEYLVTARTNDVLTFADVGGTSPTATGGKWVLRGKPKGEILHLLDYTLHYAIFGETQTAFTNAGTGEPGAGG